MQAHPSEKTYRERALNLFPWLCTRCVREFPASRLRELTVHHKDGNHDNNPLDGSNWELLCLYCHENEHARVTDANAGGILSEVRDENVHCSLALRGLQRPVKMSRAFTHLFRAM